MSARSPARPHSVEPCPPAQVTMAYSVCRGITRSNAKNFYYAFLVLPKHKRQALCAVYAFMRRCDDIVPTIPVSASKSAASSCLLGSTRSTAYNKAIRAMIQFCSR